MEHSSDTGNRYTREQQDQIAQMLEDFKVTARNALRWSREVQERDALLIRAGNIIREKNSQIGEQMVEVERLSGELAACEEVVERMRSGRARSPPPYESL
mgnify:CR=1 FL=1